MKNNFDERQLQIRGDIFKHAFILFVIFLSMDVVYSSIFDGAHPFGAVTGGIIIIVILALTSIEMILKEVYVNMLKQQNKIIMIMGICGSIALLCHVISIVIEQKPVMVHYEIQESYAMVILDLCILLIVIVNCIKQRKTKELE